MIHIRENTTLVGVSELRKGIERVLDKARKGLVIIEKRHKPKAVLMSSEEFERIQNTVEAAEDLVLGFLADERFRTAKDKDYIDIRDLIK